MVKRWGEIHDEMAEKLRPESFDDMVEHFGGRVLRVPLRRRETRAEKAARLIELLRTHTYGEAAKAIGRTVSAAVVMAKRFT